MITKNFYVPFTATSRCSPGTTPTEFANKTIQGTGSTSTTTANEDACCSACDAQTTCVGFTFTATGTSCTLYTTIDYLEAATGTTAYACTTDTTPTQGTNS